jgi:hypothetical protein
MTESVLFMTKREDAKYHPFLGLITRKICPRLTRQDLKFGKAKGPLDFFSPHAGRRWRGATDEGQLIKKIQRLAPSPPH